MEENERKREPHRNIPFLLLFVCIFDVSVLLRSVFFLF